MGSRWRAAVCGAGLALGVGGICAAAPGDWSSYAGAPGGGQHSQLTQITPDKVGRLRIAWSFRAGELGASLPDPERRRFEANPLVLGGRMYLVTGTGIAFALDAASRRELWSFDARISRGKHYSDPASRGVSFWRDAQAAAGSCRERIVFGTLDARLIALDAADGRPCAGFGTAGTIDLHAGIDMHNRPGDAWSNYAVTSPPVVAGDVLVVGSSIGDNPGHALEQGVVRGYDARSGLELWSWDPVPRAAAAAAASGWQPEQTATVGGGNAWAPLAVDPALGLVYRADRLGQSRLLRRRAARRQSRCEFAGGAGPAQRAPCVGAAVGASRPARPAVSLP